MPKTAMVRSEIAALLNNGAVELQRSEAVAHLGLLAAKFGVAGARPLWERLRDSVSLHDADGWRLVSEYVRGAAVLVIEGSDGDALGYRFKESRELTRVLEESSGYVFYVTDAEATYLLCFNDHDYLIAAGAARAWLSTSPRVSLPSERD